MEEGKRRFAEGLRYAAQHMGPLFKSSPELDALQIDAVQNSANFQDYAWKTQWYNFTRQFGFPPREAVSEKNLLLRSALELGGSVLSSHSVLASNELVCCSFDLWICSVLPPSLDPERKTTLFLVTGGLATRDFPWQSWPAEWMETHRYETWSPSEFVFSAASPNLAVRFGCPATTEFRLAVAHGEQQVNVTLQARAPPRITQNDVLVRFHNVESSVFSDMIGTVSTNTIPESACFGFVAQTRLQPPPLALFSQARFLAQPRAYAPVMSLLIQFRAYQYAMTLALNEAPRAGVVLTDLLQGVRTSFGRTERLRAVQVLIASTVNVEGQEMPHTLDVMLQNEVVTTLEACVNTSRTPVAQQNFELLLRMADVRNAYGFGVLRVQNILDIEEWAALSGLGAQNKALLDNQPLVRSWALVGFVNALPWLLLLLLVLVVVVLVLVFYVRRM